MRDLKSVQQDIGVTSTLKSVAQTYEEIAVMKIQHIRTSVLTTRDFLKRVNEVYFEVKKSYHNRILDLIAKSKDKEKFTFSTINKNGKKIKVLITADERLMGNIPQRVFNRFYTEFVQEQSDILIIGKVGKQMFDEKEIAKKFLYYDLPEYDAKMASIKDIVSAILNYEKVDVYHGRLINLVTQIEEKTNLTGGNIVEEAQQAQEDKTDYLFEPSIEDILHFFEVQIFGSLLKQSIAEANLANLGSRITAMEQATSNTELTLTKLVAEENRVKRAIENKKQLQRLSGISLWN